MPGQNQVSKFLRAHRFYYLQDFTSVHMLHLENRRLSIKYRPVFIENSCYEQFLEESERLKCYVYFFKVRTLNLMIQPTPNAHHHLPQPYFLPPYAPTTHRALYFEFLPIHSVRDFGLVCTLFLLFINISLPLIWRPLVVFLLQLSFTI